MEALERYRGHTWFRLGDRDLATHLYRTQRLREGAPLSTVTAEIADAWGLEVRLLPMTDDVVETRLTVAGEGEIGFQEYFVERRHDGARRRRCGSRAPRGPGPAPGVLDAIAGADRVVVCPSNPIVSIGPILAVPEIRDALEARRADTVAVSPIVAGAALKGPADRLLTELGHESSVVGVARLYAPFVAALVIDPADASARPRGGGRRGARDRRPPRDARRRRGRRPRHHRARTGWPGDRSTVMPVEGMPEIGRATCWLT